MNKLRKQPWDLKGSKDKSTKLELAMTGRTVNQFPRLLPIKKLINRAALPAGSETRMPPSDFNGGIDEPTIKTDFSNVPQFLVEEAEASFSLHFALCLEHAFA